MVFKFGLCGGQSNVPLLCSRCPVPFLSGVLLDQLVSNMVLEGTKVVLLWHRSKNLLFKSVASCIKSSVGGNTEQGNTLQ